MRIAFCAGLCAVFLSFSLSGQSPIPGTGYTPVTPRALAEGEIPITEPGYYGTVGATYVLMNDISSPRSAIFLGNNATLDLNGYEITFADGGYENIPNFDFEEGLVGWDFSKAPTAKIGNKQLQVFVGDNVLQLKANEEITSQYITLPEANRSYFAICGVATTNMRVSVYIEDEDGNVVYSTNSYGGSNRQGSPVENKRVQLGGGFVFAHMYNKPAGRYRVRVKANTDAIVDYIDLRPALDVGVGIVERTYTNTHTDQLYDGWYDPAFYDYSANFSTGVPIAGVPVVPAGATGTITIKNGVIRGGVNGVLSWGIQSTTSRANVVLENVKVINQGINTNAVEIRQGTITKCTFDVNTPFIINRHNSGNYAVDLLGSYASEVSYSEFYGGQGCLSMHGPRSKAHHNYFVNRQTVTNHYALAPPDYAEVYNNVFDPEEGSGIGLGRSQYTKVYDNIIYVTASPPTCEYGKEDYSVNGLRLADYNAVPGDPNGSYGNHIYNNKFIITGKAFPEYPQYLPVATAIFYSASGGDNFIYDNEVVVNALHAPSAKAITTGFYVGGGTIGGVFENNTITGNTAGIWLATPYGNATGTKIIGNTLIRADDAGSGYRPVRLGDGGALAKDISFVSNKVVGGSNKLEFTSTGVSHSYTVGWLLTINAVDKNDIPVAAEAVEIVDKDGNVVYEGVTGQNGNVEAVLLEYSHANRTTKNFNPYRIRIANTEVPVEMNSDKEITLVVNRVTGVSLQHDLKIYPNPARETLTLKFDEQAERSIVVMDLNQRICMTVSADAAEVALDVSGLSSGVYLVHVMGEDGIRLERLVKF
jgi:nitrous oxidase accessory protein NosD